MPVISVDAPLLFATIFIESRRAMIVDWSGGYSSLLTDISTLEQSC